MDNSGVDTGKLLIPENIKHHRHWFKEMAKLLGINVIYKPPLEANQQQGILGKTYDGYGELIAEYGEGSLISCIFDEHPVQKTMQKLGWNSELMENNSVIHVPYDLPNIQRGAIFIIPSGLDGKEGRVYRVLDLSTICIYPASIACLIGPIWSSDFDESKLDHSDNDFSLLTDGDIYERN